MLKKKTKNKGSATNRANRKKLGGLATTQLLYFMKGMLSIGDSEAKKKWDKENTTKVLLKLNHNTDAEILAALDPSRPKQTQIKEWIRKALSNEKKE